MGIKVKHEGNATSRFVGAQAGGKARRQAQDALKLAQMEADQAKADADRNARLYQTQLQTAASMARGGGGVGRGVSAPSGGGGSAPLTHAPTGSTLASVAAPPRVDKTKKPLPYQVTGEDPNVRPTSDSVWNPVEGVWERGEVAYKNWMAGNQAYEDRRKLSLGKRYDRYTSRLLQEDRGVDERNLARLKNRFSQQATQADYAHDADMARLRGDIDSAAINQRFQGDRALQQMRGAQASDQIAQRGQVETDQIKLRHDLMPKPGQEYSDKQKAIIQNINNTIADAEASGRFRPAEIEKMKRQGFLSVLGMDKEMFDTSDGKTAQEWANEHTFQVDGQTFLRDGNRVIPVNGGSRGSASAASGGTPAGMPSESAFLKVYGEASKPRAKTWNSLGNPTEFYTPTAEEVQKDLDTFKQVYQSFYGMTPQQAEAAAEQAVASGAQPPTAAPVPVADPAQEVVPPAPAQQPLAAPASTNAPAIPPQPVMPVASTNAPAISTNTPAISTNTPAATTNAPAASAATQKAKARGWLVTPAATGSGTGGTGEKKVAVFGAKKEDDKKKKQ